MTIHDQKYLSLDFRFIIHTGINSISPFKDIASIISKDPFAHIIELDAACQLNLFSQSLSAQPIKVVLLCLPRMQNPRARSIPHPLKVLILSLFYAITSVLLTKERHSQREYQIKTYTYKIMETWAIFYTNTTLAFFSPQKISAINFAPP